MQIEHADTILKNHNAIYSYFTHIQCHYNNESFDDEGEWNWFVETYQDDFEGACGYQLDDLIGEMLDA